MRVVRSKSFVKKDGSWEKIEVELGTEDLLPEEQVVVQSAQPTLLEIRAEKHIIAFLVRNGEIDAPRAKDMLVTLEELRKGLLKKIPLRKKNDS